MMQMRHLVKRRFYSFILLAGLVVFVFYTLLSLVITSRNVETLEVGMSVDYQKSNLNDEMGDLKRIKQSLLNELAELEDKRRFLIKELDNLDVKFVNLKQKQDEANKLNEELNHRQQLQLVREVEIDEKLKLNINFIKNLDLIHKQHLNSHIESIDYTKYVDQNSQYSLDTCFNHQNCNLNAKLKLFFLNGNSTNYIDTRINNNVFELVDSMNKACLNVYFISNQQDFIQAINTINSNINLLLIDSNNNDDDNDVFLNMTNKQLNQLKCSFYASFNQKIIFSNRHSNLNIDYTLINHDFNSINRYLNEVILEKQEQNSLFLTSNRKHVLSYHENNATKNEFFKKALSPTHLIDLNCTNDDNIKHTCFTLNKRLDILSNSTFTLLISLNQSIYWSHYLSLRLIEALSVATIPIVIGYDLKLPLNEFINWNEIIIRLPVERIHLLDAILYSLTPQDIFYRRQKAFRVYKKYFQTQSIQFKTILAVIRERLYMPAPAIDDLVTEEIDYKQILGDKSDESDLLRLNITVENSDVEYLGPIYDNKSLFVSKRYQYNFSLIHSYYKWNVLHDPFNMYPSSPFDQVEPTNLKYANLKQINLNDTLYYHGGSRGLKYFNHKLGSNYNEDEQFTIVILTYKREALLTLFLDQYLTLPYLNKIVIIWNGEEQQKPSKKFLLKFKHEIDKKMISLIETSKNSLNNRFLPFDTIKTDAILSLDDDTQLRNDEIIFGFRAWRENRERIVGFASRFHTWNITEQKYVYRSDYTCEYSLILTGAAFYHRFYSYYYTYHLDKRILETVDKFMNCEDIAFNYMVSDLIRKPPIKVTSRVRFYCLLCNNSAKINETNESFIKFDLTNSTTPTEVESQIDNMHIQEAFSSKPIHYKIRSDCINRFNRLFGYNPLLYTQTRMDSVLYKTRMPANIQKCFRYV